MLLVLGLYSTVNYFDKMRSVILLLLEQTMLVELLIILA